MYISFIMFPLCSLFSRTKTVSSQWRLILAVDYQFSTNLVPLVAAPAFVPLITPWLPLSPPAGYIRSALHITTRYISAIVHELTSLVQRHVPFLPLTINFFYFIDAMGNVMILKIIFLTTTSHFNVFKLSWKILSCIKLKTSYASNNSKLRN